ncbi:hypothetical protein [Sediminibacterium soli]|uniref:hypothetical protein n=1 Tax=Sediminibacterium soli TaxID=2698829 RepID=UPI00137AD195|nr:hypothetical protein [Sediminibacterium soli]NCI45876.1 hypothetical protein [Sediminibacterium soli]
MKPLGIILVIAGVLMCIFNTVSFTKKEKVVDLGPVEVNKTEKRTTSWPVYAGIGVGLLGIGLIAIDRKNK